jgi:hypothetical protein
MAKTLHRHNPREWWISERPPGARAVIVSTCSRASTIVSGAVIVTTCSLTFSATTIRQFGWTELQRSRWWHPSQFTSSTIRHKLSSLIFQVGATTEEKTKMTSKEKARGKDRWRNRRDSTERSQGLLWKSETKQKTGRARGQKNEGRKERLKAFIDDKETKRRRKPPLKTDWAFGGQVLC